MQENAPTHSEFLQSENSVHAEGSKVSSYTRGHLDRTDSALRGKKTKCNLLYRPNTGLTQKNTAHMGWKQEILTVMSNTRPFKLEILSLLINQVSGMRQT